MTAPAMTYASGEFVIPNAVSRHRAVVVYGDELHVIGFNPGIRDTEFDLQRLARSGAKSLGTELVDTVRDAVRDVRRLVTPDAAAPGTGLAGVIDTDALKDPDNWSTTTVRSYAGGSGCATATPGGIWMFCETNPSPLGIPDVIDGVPLAAACYSAGSSGTPAWGNDIALPGLDGKPLLTGPLYAPPMEFGGGWPVLLADMIWTGIGVTAFGPKLILAYARAAPYVAGEFYDPAGGSLMIAVFDTAAVDADAMTWAPVSVTEIPFENFGFTDAAGGVSSPISFTGVGTRVELEW